VKRGPIEIATALLLLLCAATVAAYGRSYFARDAVGVWFQGRRVFGLISQSGALSIAWLNEQRPPTRVIWVTNRRDPIAGPLGFGWKNERAGEWILSLPWWLLLLILAAALGFAWSRGRRAHIPGTCKQCGYDLRATPERCPECGAIPRPS
jgi:hypothetical protein